MSFFLGGGGSKAKPQFTGLQTQTSSSALPITPIWGQNRVANNILWQDDFETHKKKQKVGKGGGSATTYTYSASFILGLCWGPIIGIGKVWKDKSIETYAGLGMSLFLGSNPQSPWGYLTSNHPNQALGYPDIAYLAVANYDLESSNSLPQHSFEVKGLRWDTGVGGSAGALDADPALVIEDFLSSELYGIPAFDYSMVEANSLMSTASATTTGDNAFQTYCRAMGFAFSPALIAQEKATEILNRWTKLLNTALIWTGYSLKFLPYGADTVTANGVTYLPSFPIRYVITDDDFEDAGESKDPVTFDRTDPADAFNTLSLIISNRSNEYNELPVSWHDQGLVDEYGRKPEDNFEAREITEPDMAAILVTLMGQRKSYVRNTFNFTLPPKYCLLEAGDIVTLQDPRLGSFNLMITEIEENEEGH